MPSWDNGWGPYDSWGQLANCYEALPSYYDSEGNAYWITISTQGEWFTELLPLKGQIYVQYEWDNGVAGPGKPNALIVYVVKDKSNQEQQTQVIGQVQQKK